MWLFRYNISEDEVLSNAVAPRHATNKWPGSHSVATRYATNKRSSSNVRSPILN